MWFIYLMSWISLLCQVGLLTLAVGAALYYLAELMEEYTSVTKQIINGMLIASCFVYFGLWVVEGFPLLIVGLGLLTNFFQFKLLKSFPFVEPTQPSAILTGILVLVDHYYAFEYFTSVYYNFSEVLAYFTLCLWLIPFAFVISLSASDNVLPSHMQRSYGGDGKCVG